MPSVISKRWVTSALALTLAVSCSSGRELHGTKDDPPGLPVKAAMMLDAKHGWVLTEGRFVMTDDAGETWHDLTPVDIAAAQLRAAFFLDTARGWLVGESPRGKLRVYRFQDGQWKVGADDLPGSSSVSIHFSDSSNGWLASPGEDTSETLGQDLRVTHDGGASWRPAGSDLSGGERVFSTGAGESVVTSSFGLQQYTRDGDRSETVVLPPLPSTCAKGGVCAIALTQPASLPLIPPGKMLGTNGSAVGLFTRVDETGWKLEYEARLRAPRGSGFIPFAAAGSKLLASQSGSLVTVDPCCSSVRAGELPRSVTSITFGSEQVGWAIAGDPSFLYATTDGGTTWTKREP